ncbi:BCCT family transporter [Photobacterium phosphoreum]|jgi:BCCT family betaine/carnitine transporter|uniref:BCCT family transporter n=1 Tax=Photobacterium phosphoreum TaxID=659 RepID=A0A2T3PNB2_PHOPO|nr:BCCT family transporter [Photobacterium phosphoreum]MCD9462956.1 BCCT family transporter [Photobacterium phosphoreum]MCD9474569.1 BCCT family transporter [Photobacterium phosphoreum]MCD9478088.1 BCCT family transporter [Photobacterium phosphoreum]MCD9502567.1 BCCT family transporter [Photobacterium phosphoreum]MCD9506203.1 BCCT family transporter [Photobacterium phosphoreum]
MSKHDKYSIDNTDYTIGQDNVQKWGFDVHNAVFGVSAGLIIIFLVAILVSDPATAKAALDSVKGAIVNQFASLFMWAANFFVFFCLALIISPYGRIRIGGQKAKPDHSTLSWLSMLFSAGMGIGLMFWSVAEPAAYFTGWGGSTPLNVTPDTPEAFKVAMGATMYHWGLHPWSIYAVVGLSMAFFCYNKGLPLSIRSVFYPILGDRTWGWAGHIIDILAVLATLFGLATSLGLGAQQAASGINHVFGMHGGLWLQITIIVVVTMAAIYSVVKGIDSGVKLLSNINMLVAVVLLIFVTLVSFSVTMDTLPKTIMGYIENFIPLSDPNNRPDEKWMHSWTIVYWAWWISWSPFVGSFIARISRGRTVREFLIAVIITPTVVTSLWMSVFGGQAIHQIMDHIGTLGTKGITEVPLAMFQMYDALPLGSILSFISVILILVFFVTSSDSGSLVIDSITAGGKIDAPIPQRVFWASIEGLIAIALLWVGGTQAIQALQAGTISTALPFTFILIVMCISLLMGFRTERYK